MNLDNGVKVNYDVLKKMVANATKENLCYSISFVGNTGVGKSALVSSLLKGWHHKLDQKIEGMHHFKFLPSAPSVSSPQP